MGYTTLLRIARMATLLIVQLVILNHLHLFGYATPLLIGYMMICFDTSTSRTTSLLWGFATGIIFDLFSNTAGVGAASCTLLAMVQPYLLKLYMPRDVNELFKPTIQTLTLQKYICYILSCMGVIHFAFYMLQAFTMADFWLTLGAIIGGTLLASLFVVCIEFIIHNKKEDTEVISGQ
ncbi:MAG: rod shape-determining protein MreD [Prevotellaceae bacterium]|nr:rod shape-determining protein MreD [Candidatus Colivivens caballi]